MQKVSQGLSAADAQSWLLIKLSLSQTHTLISSCRVSYRRAACTSVVTLLLLLRSFLETACVVNMETDTDVLLVTANVGSLFNNVSRMASQLKSHYNDGIVTGLCKNSNRLMHK